MCRRKRKKKCSPSMISNLIDLLSWAIRLRGKLFLVLISCIFDNTAHQLLLAFLPQICNVQLYLCVYNLVRIGPMLRPGSSGILAAVPVTCRHVVLRLGALSNYTRAFPVTM